MCLIAYVKPASEGAPRASLSAETIDLAFQRNPDGFGVAWRAGDELFARKWAPADKAEGRAFLLELQANPLVTSIVAHWRFATCGAKDAARAHPFEIVDPDDRIGPYLIFHNGTIDLTTRGAESDTQVFVEQVVSELPSRWWESAAYRWLVGESIGWSRLLVYTIDGVTILNEEAGKWDGGIWYSSSYLPSPPVVVTSYKAPVYMAPGSGTSVSALLADKASPPTSPRGARARKLARKAARRAAEQPENMHRLGYNAGHLIAYSQPIVTTRDGTYAKAAYCAACRVRGDVYVIDHTIVHDIDHNLTTASEMTGAWD